MVAKRTLWLVLLLLLGACGAEDDFDMSTRKWKPRYKKPYQPAFMSDMKVTVGKDHTLVNACIDDYAKCRRNNLALNYNFERDVLLVPSADIGSPKQVLDIPIGQRIRPFGTVKVWILCYASLTDATLYVTLGKLATTISVTGNAAPYEWYSATFTVGEGDITDSDHLKIMAASTVANTVITLTFRSVSVYQIGTASGNWVDLTSAQCRIGTTDFPDDAYSRKVLIQKLGHIHQYKLPSGNIYNCWNYFYDKVGNFSATTDKLGRYKIVKRRGVSTLRVLVLQTSTGAGNWTIKSTIGAVAQDTLIAGSSGVLTHTALTDHVYAGADITNELEFEFKLDAEDTSTTAGTMKIVGISIVEVLGTPVAHSVPTLDEVNHRRSILASTFNDIRNTCESIWADAGRQIVLSDWRTYQAPSFYADDTVESKITYGTSQCVVARALAYFSTGSARLKIKMGFHTTTGSDHWKYIKFAIAQTAVAAEEDTGPGQGATYQFKEEITSVITVIQDELAIPAAHLNSTADTWVWVLAWTENATEYIIPDWVTIEEVPLAQTEFP